MSLDSLWEQDWPAPRHTPSCSTWVSSWPQDTCNCGEDERRSVAERLDALAPLPIDESGAAS